MREEQGSQALEFALVLPALGLLLALLLHAALLGGDIVAAQGLAREAARAAAVGEDPNALAQRATPGRVVAVRVIDEGAHVRVRVRLRTRAFAAFGQQLDVGGEAAMRRETPGGPRT